MKYTITLCLFLIFSASAYSQSKNSISLVYASTPNFIDIHNVIGDFGYKDNTGSTVGLNYQRYIWGQVFSLQSGLFYSYDKVELTAILPNGVGYQNGDIKMLTIPVLANFTFFKYFFIDGGINVDFQTNYTSASAAPNQSGIGYELGFGGKYTFRQITFFVNPFIQEHNLASFNSSQRNYNLIDSGFKFGLGYNF